MKRIICGMLCIICCFSLLSTTVYGKAWGANDTGYFYRATTYNNALTKIEGEAECQNPKKKTTDIHTESCTRTKTWKDTTGGIVSFGAEGKTSVLTAIKAEVTVKNEVELGKTVSQTSSHSWEIPAKTNYLCQWGYKKAKTEGYVYRVIKGVVARSVKINTYWSTRAYYGGRIIK